MPPPLFAALTASAVTLFVTCTAQAADMVPNAMLKDLNLWLDRNTTWAEPEQPPTIRFVESQDAEEAGQGAWHGSRLRGLYDAPTATITLVRPWSANNPQDVAILLHELVHHRQQGHHWYCIGAMEEPAYRLQAAWLAERGLAAPVNWLAVVLDAGCTARDIHPD